MGDLDLRRLWNWIQGRASRR